jgi:hypothetical protein
MKPIHDPTNVFFANYITTTRNLAGVPSDAIYDFIISLLNQQFHDP